MPDRDVLSDRGARPSFERLECIEHPGAPLEGHCPDQRCSECGVIAGAVPYVRRSEVDRLREALTQIAEHPSVAREDALSALGIDETEATR